MPQTKVKWSQLGDLDQQATDPAAPASGYTKVYAKTDGLLYARDSAGNIQQLALLAIGTSAPSAPVTNMLWVDTN